jgi:hypothetical protein
VRGIFIDTSGFYALEDKSDNNHKAAKVFWEKIAQKKAPLFITDYIFDETYTLLRSTLGYEKAIGFGESIKESTVVQVVQVDEEVQEEAWKIAKNYKDKDFSFTDCTSFVVMKNMGLKEAFSFDRHFKEYGFLGKP